MNRSVLEAIEAGDWAFEPEHSEVEFRATNAAPGSPEKLEILAHRIQAGLPLWHPLDRTVPGATIVSSVGANQLAYGAYDVE